MSPNSTLPANGPSERAAPPWRPLDRHRALGALQAVPKDTVLYWEGDTGGCRLRLHGGVVRAVRYTEDGERQVLGFFWPTETIDLAEGEICGCTIEAVTDCQIAPLPARGHRDGAGDRQTGLHKVLMDKTITTLAVVGCKSVMSRVAWFLLQLRGRVRDIAGAKDVIDFDFPRADLADYLGTRTETICRTLAVFRGRGLIEPFEARHLRILDAQGLAALAHDRSVE